jgi:phenylpyruvate tautomerase PptA (4-oxalocrotonate tautomerase family)
MPIQANIDSVNSQNLGQEPVMPHIQLDAPGPYPLGAKRDLARRIGALFAEIMQTTPDLVDVTIRELGEGALWRCGDGEPQPAAVLTCDIRRGRLPEQRARLADALVDACVEALGLDPLRLTVEFTQHPGDEAFRKVLVDGVLRGGLGRDWTESETTTPMIQSLTTAKRAGG